MLKLSDLQPLCTAESTIRGTPITLRAVTMREEETILAALPEPQPGGDTPAARMLDLNSASFRSKITTWRNQTAAAKAGIAAGLTNSAGEAFEVTRGVTWVVKWVNELCESLTSAEVNQILRDLHKAEGLFADEAELIGSHKKAGMLICPPAPASWSDGSAEPPDFFRLPERYGETETAALLRAAERFGTDPAVALRDWTPEVRKLAHLYNVLRTAEECRQRENELKVHLAAAGAKVE